MFKLSQKAPFGELFDRLDLNGLKIDLKVGVDLPQWQQLPRRRGRGVVPR